MADSLWRYGLQRTSLWASLFFSISQGWFKLMPIESMMPSNHLILCCPLLLLPSVFDSIMFFLNESALHIRWPKYCSFSFTICSFRVDFFWHWLIWSSRCPRDSQESSSAPQFKSINSSVLSFLYSSTLTSIHETLLCLKNLLTFAI